MVRLELTSRPNKKVAVDRGRHVKPPGFDRPNRAAPGTRTFAFGHLKIDVTGLLRRKLWRGSACIWGIVPEPAVAVDAGRHTGFARFHGSPAAAATELCVRALLKIDVPGLLVEKVVAWVGLCLGYRAQNKPLQLTPAAILVSRRGIPRFSSGRRN